jgi:hypothetical protein
LLTLGLATNSNPVKADAYFGARLEVLLIVPVLGIQLGYEFGDQSENRFGIRAGLESVLLINRATLDGTFRFADSSVYFGGGLGFTLAPYALGAASRPQPEYHVLIGNEFPVANAANFYLEAQFGLLTNTAVNGFTQFVSLAAGFNWHF